MPKRRAAYPSALKSGVTHFAMSTAVVTGLGMALAATLHVTGDPADAGPTVQVALFDPVDQVEGPDLKSRLPDLSVPDLQIAAMLPVAETPSLEEPSLGVEYASDRAPQATVTANLAPVPTVEEGDKAETLGVRINGKTVLPGEAFSQVRALQGLPTAPIAGLQTRTRYGMVPTIAEDGTAPVDAYARPFDNRLDQPTVSIILGGLGLNYTHTKTAIEQLPPEVTLAFSPHARGLRTWIRRARDAGHEVLIELPLEATEYGRVRPHPLTITTDLSDEAVADRLDRFLASGTGYFGVINYQGDKLAQDSAQVARVLSHLESRGLAFIEDGSLSKSVFEAEAEERSVRYAKADKVIDTRIDANAMQQTLMALETEATETGSSLGTAIAYPITIDALRDWTAALEDRGLRLAPASYNLPVPSVVARTPDGSDPENPGDATGLDVSVLTGEVTTGDDWDVVTAKPLGIIGSDRS